MVREVRVYVEGGGDSRDSKDAIRKGFRHLFQKVGIGAQVIACGRRDKAFKDWKLALFSHPDAFNLLLVDAEGAVREGSSSWNHLKTTDPSWQPPLLSEEHCHLMVQVMEAWFIADPEALAAYYGQRFGASALPGRQNVEEIPKGEVESSLKSATKRTQKGEYHKIRHASDLLARIDPAKVRKRAPHCERLLTTLANVGA
ncbi:MAG: DUF4276 family protein [Acidobacteriota bacterium]